MRCTLTAENVVHRGRIWFLSLALVLVVVSTPVTGAPAAGRDALYQVSTIDALMAGLYDGTTSIGQLTRHGDFGLGTFDKLDGEMVVLDGVFYQVKADGLVYKPPTTTTTPFAAVTFLDSDISAATPHEMTLSQLKDYLDGMLPSKNLFYAIRIDGLFSYVKTRSVPAQAKPYRRLADVASSQPEFEFHNVEGTLVVLRCPYFSQSVNVPGYHLHFISADRKQGGHLLDCILKKGAVSIDTTPEFALSLPGNDEFLRTMLEADNQESLKKVEQGDTK